MSRLFLQQRTMFWAGSETVQRAREGRPYLKSSGMHLLLNQPLELSAANPFPFYECEQYACFSCGNGP